VKYLQHSRWANDLYRPYFGDRCTIWPAGIDTSIWRPTAESRKTIDFLLYDKVLWNYDRTRTELLDPIRAVLRRRGFVFREMRYGFYDEREYSDVLSKSRAMILLVEHESQGLAYQECLASGVPVLAWDQGRWLDPNRFRWGTPEVAATSVPYWDDRCGMRFTNAAEFPERLDEFLSRLKSRVFAPRDYVMENLTLERSTQRFLEILSTVYDS
jgi:glycosyltransferase involved in cell wall biosynthesis